MSSNRFRPTLTSLENRETPSVSPGDVSAALWMTSAVEGSLRYYTDHLADAHLPSEIHTIATFTAEASVMNHNAANTLTQYVAELQQQIAADPQNAASLAPVVAQMNAAAGQASMNATFSRWMSVGYGTPASAIDQVTNPSSPPPPAAAPPDNSNNNTNNNTPTSPPPATSPPPPTLTQFPTDQLTTTMPPLDDPRWVTLPTGERILDVKTGTGPAVPAGATVTVNYIGWLAATGVKFDANADHGGAPFTASLTPGQSNSVIVGWNNGIPGMQPGGLRFIDIPAANAYGAAGFPPTIPANAELVFEVQLISSP